MPAQNTDSLNAGPYVIDGMRCLSRREAAAMLSISERTLYERTAPRGPIQPVRCGRRVLYNVVELERYIMAGGGTAPQSNVGTSPKKTEADQ